MIYVQLAVGFHTNPKILNAGNAAAGLYARALSYCGDHLTNGYLPKAWARTFGRPTEIRSLTREELWEPISAGDVRHVTYRRPKHAPVTVAITMPGDGFFIADYLFFNYSHAEVEALKEAKADAGRKGAESRWNGLNTDVDDGSSHDEPIADAIADGMANGWQGDSSRARTKHQHLDQEKERTSSFVESASRRTDDDGSETDEAGLGQVRALTPTLGDL